jgi:protein AFG1
MAGFLDALKARCDVVELDGGKDWRSGTGAADVDKFRARWFLEGDTGFEDVWRDALNGEEGMPSSDHSLFHASTIS